MLKISTQLMVDEARRRGWQAEPLNEDASSVVAVTLPNGQRHYFYSSVTNISSASGFAISEDKLATYLVAQQLGVPVAAYIMYDAKNPGAAHDFLQQQTDAGYELVVKPIDREHGDGATIGVRDQQQLTEALQYALKFSNNIILQRRHQGTDCRVAVVDGVCVAAAYRAPAFVVGDGVHTIQQLIDIKNQDPKRGEGHSAAYTRIDLEHVRRYIGAEALPTVPEAGKHVTLLGTANLSKGGEAIDITDDMHESYKQAAEKIANALGLGLCGVDLLCQDFTRPMSAENTILLEINGPMGLRMHHFPSQGKPRNIAGAILDAFEKRNIQA